MPISTPTGEIIPLHEVATIQKGLSPVEIQRLDQTRAIPVYSQLYDVDLGTTIERLENELAEVSFPLGVGYSYGSETEWMEDAFFDLSLVLILGIILVFMVLASKFESLWQPFVILFSIPFGFIGVALALFLTRGTLNIVSLIGVIMLVGIVVNNAIVFLDYINQLRQKSMGRTEAIVQAGKVRLRPI